MKSFKILVVAIGLIVLTFSPLSSVWSGTGSPGTGLVTCLVNNPGNGALAIKGTVAIQASPWNEPIGNQDVDATMRLERSGTVRFFRLHLADTSTLNGLTNEEIACRLFNPFDKGTPANTAVQDLVQSILTEFDIPLNWFLVITGNSISEFSEQEEIDSTGVGSGLANITIYAVRP